MTQEDANKVRDDLLYIIKKHGLWYNYIEQNKPNPKMIIYIIKIKIDNNEEIDK